MDAVRLRWRMVLLRKQGVSLQDLSSNEIVVVGTFEVTAVRSGHTEWASSMAEWPSAEEQWTIAAGAATVAKRWTASVDHAKRDCRLGLFIVAYTIYAAAGFSNGWCSGSPVSIWT